jgi:hypothetical protein
VLIKVPTEKDKNPYWEKRGITPNEAYELDGGYQRLVTQFKLYNGIQSPCRFLEIRIIKRQTLVDATGQIRWWDDTLFMDKVFWAFQSPAVDYVDDKPYSFYVLEPYECQRVLNLGWAKYGRPPVNDLKAAFFVPVECCQHAWNETSAGYSDHLRPRPKRTPSQKDIDRRATQEREGRKLLDRAIDAADDPRFEKMYTVLERAVRNGAPTNNARSGKL